MPSIESTPGAMSLSELQSRSLAPSLEVGGLHALAVQGLAQRLPASHGNQLLGLDVWAGSSAAERLLGGADTALPGGGVHLDQLVGHILAPLG
ncbi:hypothetical protein AB4083_16750 [Dyella sp. 2RAB6]